MIKTKPFTVEIPSTHSCAECGRQVPLSEYRIRYGKRYCSISCEDDYEQRNQANDYEMAFYNKED